MILKQKKCTGKNDTSVDCKIVIVNLGTHITSNNFMEANENDVLLNIIL